MLVANDHDHSDGAQYELLLRIAFCVWSKMLREEVLMVMGLSLEIEV